MNMTDDRDSELKIVGRDAARPPGAPFDDAEAYDLARQINARRAELEDPELLRRLRSL